MSVLSLHIRSTNSIINKVTDSTAIEIHSSRDSHNYSMHCMSYCSIDGFSYYGLSGAE